MSAAYFNQYLASQVNAASPEELLVMLYNGAIRFLSEAESAMADGRVARRGELISKCICIINELDVTLNHEVGGQIATNLDALYAYMNRELLLANIKDDPTRLAQVRQLLVGLRDTWLQAIEQLQNERAEGKSRPLSETVEASSASAQAL